NGNNNDKDIRGGSDRFKGDRKQHPLEGKSKNNKPTEKSDNISIKQISKNVNFKTPDIRNVASVSTQTQDQTEENLQDTLETITPNYEDTGLEHSSSNLLQNVHNTFKKMNKYISLPKFNLLTTNSYNLESTKLIDKTKHINKNKIQNRVNPILLNIKKKSSNNNKNDLDKNYMLKSFIKNSSINLHESKHQTLEPIASTSFTTKYKRNGSSSSNSGSGNIINELDMYNGILDVLYQNKYRYFEYVYFNIISLRENNLTYDKLKSMNSEKKKNLKVKEFLKSKIPSSSHIFKNLEPGKILPFYTFEDVKLHLHKSKNDEQPYYNKDLYVIILDTTFNKQIKKAYGDIVTTSLSLINDSDDISYFSIKNNNYHFTNNNCVIHTKEIYEKASAILYERTLVGPYHWGDDVDLDGFQKMFKIGLILFYHEKKRILLHNSSFNRFPLHLIMYYYEGLHFEPAIHIVSKNQVDTIKSIFENDKIPPSFRSI
ncbi:conserved protein, unknown function, partial [Hepatocystis sp. ex Piliocolobus tephrosceles]